MLGCGGAGLAGVQQNSYEKNTPITGVCAKRETIACEEKWTGIHREITRKLFHIRLQ